MSIPIMSTVPKRLFPKCLLFLHLIGVFYGMGRMCLPPGTKRRLNLSNFPNWNNIKFAIKTTISFYSCLFGLRVYVPVDNFSVMSGRFPELNQY